MKIKIFILMLLLIASVCNAAIDWDIYSGTETIETGDDYGIVNVYNNASLDMTGGEVVDLSSYDVTSFDMFSGTILRLHALGSSVINIYDGLINQHLDAFDMSIINFYGGTVNDYIFATDSSEVHIYGYDFVFTPSSSSYFLSGYWETGTQFNLYLRGPDTYPRVNLHEIPEPASMVMFALGICLLRSKKD
jgi:hypothetical protein